MVQQTKIRFCCPGRTFVHDRMQTTAVMWLAILFGIILLAISFRKIPEGQRGVVRRPGSKQPKVVGPGVIVVVPLLDRLQLVSVKPLSVSLPPQSAITKDEIPIQLQASLDAVVRNADLAVVKATDRRIFPMSQLQAL